MKNIRTATSQRNLPTFSVTLLILALCLSIAAWRALEINPDAGSAPACPQPAPIELKQSSSPAIQAAYRAHRHEAASLGEDATGKGAIRSLPGGSILKRAIL